MCQVHKRKHPTGEEESRELERVALLNAFRRLRELSHAVNETLDQIGSDNPREEVVVSEEVDQRHGRIYLQATIREVAEDQSIISEDTVHHAVFPYTESEDLAAHTTELPVIYTVQHNRLIPESPPPTRVLQRQNTW